MSFLIQTLFSIFLFSLVCSAQASEKTEPVSKQASSIHLTAKERIWLSKHKNIRIAFDGSLPPYSFVNKRGKFDGIAIEIINTVSQRLGIKFKTYPNASWNKLYSAAGKRKVDVVATMVDRPDRRLWFNFTQPYLTKSLVIMTRLDNTTIKNREDLKKKTVALTKGYHYGDVLRRQFPSVKPYYVDDMLNGLKALQKGKVDAAVTFMATARYLQKKYSMDNLQFADFYDRNSADESIAVRSDWPILAGILQKGLDSLTAKETENIFAKWVPRVETPVEKVVAAPEQPPVQVVEPIKKEAPPKNDYLYLINLATPFAIILIFLLAWLVHAHHQNRKIIQSKKQILKTNKNLQTLQSDLEHLVLKRTAELNSSEQKFRSLVENLRNEYFFYHLDNTGAFTYVSPSISNILGYEPEDFMAHYRDYLSDNPINQKIDEYTDLCRHGVPNPPYQVEIYDRRKTVHWLEIADSPVYDEYGNCVGVDGIVRDVTVRKLADERLIRLSYYDELTGLANRRLFTDRLQQALSLAARNKTSIALFYLDLDNFKTINDSMGHSAGDEILKEASRRLTSSLRDSDVAARLGGDEFILLLPGTDSDAAIQVAKKIQKMFRIPYLLGDKTAALGASIGIAVYPQHGREGETLVGHADIAMYHSKKQNLDFCFYSENMEQALGYA